MKRTIMLFFLTAALCLLSGCAILTVDEMYCLPERSEDYHNLQSAMNSAMSGHEYCAPLAGENQQTVQTADLDGDGKLEYLLFAKCSSDMPLEIMIFNREGEEYVLCDTISGTGSAFDQVEYVQMDGKQGIELVVGRQLSNRIERSLSVYTFVKGQAQQILSTNYTKFLTCDLDSDLLSELLVLRPGQSDTDKGVAELYGMENDTMERSKEALMSAPVDQLKRILIGSLHGGKPAVFVGTTVEENALITDVYAVVDGAFTNVSLSNESGTSVQTLRNYYVYAEDIDGDGEVELPDLITMKSLDPNRSVDRQYLIRWYAMDEKGNEIDKLYTYHNYVGGWYLQLDPQWAGRVTVAQEGSTYDFYLWNRSFTKPEKLLTIYTLTGKDRGEQAVAENRFMLYTGETTVFAANLEVASGSVEITRESLIKAFQLIRQDWKTGEM